MKHEYGHIVQESILGEEKYLLCIAIPSAINCDKYPNNDRGYYSQLWECTADIFGKVKTNERPGGYEDGARLNAILYFVAAVLHGL